jgi:response regulator of citrate/malate metabolism
MEYFNTTHVTNPELLEYQAKAQTQKEIILSIMSVAQQATASEIWLGHFVKSCPVTSVRRAMTCLMKEGKLIKTPIKKIGLWGRPEYVYKINEY